MSLILHPPSFWGAYDDHADALHILTRKACPAPCVGHVNETGWHKECERKAREALEVLRPTQERPVAPTHQDSEPLSRVPGPTPTPDGGSDGLETRTAAEALDLLHDRVRWHYDHAADAEHGDMTAANHAVSCYGHVLELIATLRTELVDPHGRDGAEKGGER